MTTIAIASTESAASRGIHAPADKTTHVIDSASKSVLFSTNSIERAGQFEAAKIEEQAALARASKMREEVKHIEAEAAKASAKAAAVVKLDGGVALQLAAAEGVGIGGGAAAATMLLQALFGADEGYGAFVLYTALGLAIGGTLVEKNPRLAAAVGAAGMSLGGACAMRTAGLLPMPSQQ